MSEQISSERMGELKRQANGFRTVTEARATPHEYDDGEIVSYCVLCGRLAVDYPHLGRDQRS